MSPGGGDPETSPAPRSAAAPPGRPPGHKRDPTRQRGHHSTYRTARPLASPRPFRRRARPLSRAPSRRPMARADPGGGAEVSAVTQAGSGAGAFLPERLSLSGALETWGGGVGWLHRGFRGVKCGGLGGDLGRRAEGGPVPYPHHHLPAGTPLSSAFPTLSLRASLPRPTFLWSTVRSGNHLHWSGLFRGFSYSQDAPHPCPVAWPGLSAPLCRA